VFCIAVVLNNGSLSEINKILLSANDSPVSFPNLLQFGPLNSKKAKPKKFEIFIRTWRKKMKSKTLINLRNQTYVTLPAPRVASSGNATLIATFPS